MCMCAGTHTQRREQDDGLAVYIWNSYDTLRLFRANELKCPWNELHPARLTASGSSLARVCAQACKCAWVSLSLWMTPSLQADILSTLRTISLMKGVWVRDCPISDRNSSGWTKPSHLHPVFGTLAPWQRASSQCHTDTSDAAGSSHGDPIAPTQKLSTWCLWMHTCLVQWHVLHYRMVYVNVCVRGGWVALSREHAPQHSLLCLSDGLSTPSSDLHRETS